MNITKKHLLYGLIPVFALAIVGASSASAHGLFGGNQGEKPTFKEQQHHRAERLQTLSDVTGISTDDLEQGRQDGFTLQELIEQRGLDSDEIKSQLQQEKLNRVTERLEAAVAEGKLSQEQADLRLEQIQERIENGDGHFGHHGKWGHRHGPHGFEQNSPQ